MLTELLSDVVAPRVKSILLAVESYRVRRAIQDRDSATVTRPVFIVGVPRSGTTMLYRALCRHPDLAWFSHEELPRFMTPQRRAYVRRSLARRRARGEKIPSTENSVVAFGVSWHRPLEGSSRLPIEATTFWKCLLDHRGSSLSRKRARKLVTAVHDLVEARSRARFVGKCPWLNTRLGILEAVFPDAKFVHIVRDPRAVVASAVARRSREGFFELAESKGRPDTPDFVERCARDYRETLEAIHGFSERQDEKTFTTLRYEDLLDHRDREMTRMLHFCELQVPARIDDIAQPIEDTREKWKTTLEDGAGDRVLAIVRPAIERANLSYGSA